MATPAQAPSPDDSVRQLLSDIGSKVDWLDVTEEELEDLGAFDCLAMSREEWREVESRQSKEDHERLVTQRAEWLREFIRNKLIFKWLDDSTRVRDEWQRKQVANTIRVYLRDEREEELVDHLTDVATVGAEKAEKRRTRSLRGRTYPIFITWELLLGLVRILATFAVLAAANNKFETIVFAILIFIYCGVVRGFRTERYYNGYLTVRAEVLLSRVLLKLKHEELEWEKRSRLEGERKVNQVISRRALPFVIADVSYGLVWLIAVYNLVMTVI